MHAERKFVDIGTLAAEVEDADLWIGYTTVESRFRVRLEKSVENVQSEVGERIESILTTKTWTARWLMLSTDLVLAVAVTSSWSSGHCESVFEYVALLANRWCRRKREVQQEVGVVIGRHDFQAGLGNPPLAAFLRVSPDTTWRHGR